MTLLIDVSIDGLRNEQEDEVIKSLETFLTEKYGKFNVAIDVNGDTEYDEEDEEDED